MFFILRRLHIRVFYFTKIKKKFLIHILFIHFFKIRLIFKIVSKFFFFNLKFSKTSYGIAKFLKFIKFWRTFQLIDFSNNGSKSTEELLINWFRKPNISKHLFNDDEFFDISRCFCTFIQLLSEWTSRVLYCRTKNLKQCIILVNIFIIFVGVKRDGLVLKKTCIIDLIKEILMRFQILLSKGILTCADYAFIIEAEYLF